MCYFIDFQQNLGYDKLFEILVQNSANTTVKDLYGSTALMLAARQGNIC